MSLIITDEVPSRPEDRKSDPHWAANYGRMLRSYLPFYATEILRGPAEYGGKFLLGPHHLKWGDAINQSSRILALAARDHGKSHFWCFAYPIWMADKVAPGRVGYIFSATATQAEEHLKKIREEIEGGGENADGSPNPRLQHLLPFRKVSNKVLKFANGSEIRARGFGTRVRGGHPFWQVSDDVLNDDHIWSERIRTKAVDYYLSAIEPMIVPGGQGIVVGTPFHAQDLYRHLEDTGGAYHVMKDPAVSPDGKPLWPGRYNMKALEVKKAILRSSIRWSREFLCQPISDEASLFPSWLFDGPGIKQPYPLGLPAEHWRNLGMECFAGVDLAMSTSAGADFMVVFVIAVDSKTGDRYVVDIIRRKGLGYQEQVNLIIAASKRYSCGLVFCEANQFQRVISDMVVRTSDVPIKAMYTTGKLSKAISAQRRGMKQTYSANKNALDQGVPALRMLLENGKLKIPWAPESRETVGIWLGEMQAFGWAEGKMQGVGAHDDTVMSLWIADRAAAVGGQFSFGFDADVPPEGEEGDPLGFGDGFGGFDDEDGDDWRPKEGVRVAP